MIKQRRKILMIIHACTMYLFLKQTKRINIAKYRLVVYWSFARVQ